MAIREKITIASISPVIKEHLSSISSREIAEQQMIYNKNPSTNNTIKTTMKYSLSPFMERPIPFKNVTWQTTDTRYKIINIADLPLDLFAINGSLRSMFKSFAFFRAKACLYVTLTGTINHQGTLLLGVTPNNYAYNSVSSPADMINTLLTSPHCMLGANEATAACVEIPFYVNADFITLGATTGTDASVPDFSINNSRYAQAILMVMNPLSVTGASSTSLTVHYEIKFTDFEVYVQTPSNPNFVSPPTFLAESFIGPVITNSLDLTANLVKKTSSDFIDALRKTVKAYTGLHNPNVPEPMHANVMLTKNRTNLVDAPTFYEKLDPYSKFSRLTKDAIFHTEIDEMELQHILSKPQYLGTFEVLTTQGNGRLLWSRPISPWQGGCYGGVAVSSNIERLYYNTQAWSGDMELIIQSSMTNKQNVKLMVSRMYGLDRRILTQVPDLDSCRSGITTLLEFSGGNQQLTVDLDFLSRNQVLYNTVDLTANALMHGMYYIHLQQPMVSGEGSPLSIEFNVYLRCKPNFRYYGYGMRPGYTSSKLNTGPFYPNPLPVLREVEEEKEEFVAESAESAAVMNIPSTDQALLNRDLNDSTPAEEIERMKPVLHLRDLVRRVQNTSNYNVTSDGNGFYTLSIPVTDLINHFPTLATAQSSGSSLMKMYYAINSGLRVKIRSNDATNFNVQYYPPTLVSGASASAPTTAYMIGNVVSGLNSSFVSAKNNLSSAPLCEAPHVWGLDLTGASAYSILDVHIPHTTMYHWWGGAGWSAIPSSSFDTNSTLMNNMGHLIITGRTAFSTNISFSIFAGMDDEGRLGFHTLAPLLFLPLTNDGLYYDLPEKIPTSSAVDFSRVAPPSLYYNSLTTAYNTSPIV